MLRELYPSDLKKWVREVDDLREWLPFFGSNSEAISHVASSIVRLNDAEYVFGWFEKKRLEMLIACQISESILTITAVQVRSKPLSWRSCHIVLEHIAKQFRATRVRLRLSKTMSYFHERLEKIGYVYTDTYYDKVISYHTGLVLGGGGARGSYQIGAWRALLELGSTFDLISGTSVGALNGGLILQGDLESAQKMWQSIDTQKILSVPVTSSESDFTISRLLTDVQALTISALTSMGVGTDPLLKMIKDLMTEEVIFNTDKQFFIVTTQAPKMTETVVSLKEMTKDTFPKWLLASSSFFPAMKMCQIGENYYVDGGYRNNIPKDVLIEAGATELIVVNVKGPGVTKSVKLPKDMSVVTIESHWGLGNVLLFDGKRSNWNMLLGYLETMKAFHFYEGEYYTFPRESFKREVFNLSRSFLSFMLHQTSVMEWVNTHYNGDKTAWVLSVASHPEWLSWQLLEDIAKRFEIDPAHLYTLDELADEIVLSLKNDVQQIGYGKESMLLSSGEWLTHYIRHISPISDKQWLMTYYQLFQTYKDEQQDLFSTIAKHSWQISLEAMFLIFLEKRGE